MHGTLMYLNFSQQLSLFFFFLFFLSLPSKTPRPLPSKKASGLSQLAVEVQGSLFLPLCQHNHFFSAGTMKNNKNNSGWKKSDICLEWLSYRLKTRNPLPSKNAFDPISPSLFPQWCAPLGPGETAVEGQGERGCEETLWNVLEKRRGAVNPPNGCGRVRPPLFFFSQ